MYNPLPPGKLANSGAARGAPQWQPLQPLKPIELQNAGFVQENYLQPKSSHFALWTVEEQLEAGKMADAAEERANSDENEDPNEPEHPEMPDNLLLKKG
mgnify:CR=1 FL=1